MLGTLTIRTSLTPRALGSLAAAITAMESWQVSSTSIGARVERTLASVFASPSQSSNLDIVQITASFLNI